MATVLIVDDDKGIQFLMSEYLSAFGFQTITAGSAAQARSRLKHSRCDFIISDFNMPGDSGLDLFRYVSRGYPDVPFILMTGAHDSRVKREALRMVVYKYLEKPFQFSELMKIISNHGMRSRRIAASA